MLFAAGLNVYAKCFDFLNQSCHKIECCCCNSKMNHFSKSSTPVVNSAETQCPCSVKTSIPRSSAVQIFSSIQQPLAELSKISENFSTASVLIKFTDINYHKIRPKPNIVINNNLLALRTVILLN